MFVDRALVYLFAVCDANNIALMTIISSFGVLQVEMRVTILIWNANQKPAP